ncbi:alanine racemase [Macrococcus hajekii]|uniref:Alanine racemase n=1 Tax=Macrococcus hajekii TaxID=198482 RepID=A0A4R6BJC2_9STAP|nr:alanine racemase [Macrococcus hajekii]TDM01747.1 alanine racemase [Macrococcus hajekii]GGB07092.1 alanine racemase 2 [Macrococcus hajekii]
MTAKWTLDTQTFKDNIQHVIQGQPVMAVVKNNAYHYGLDFAVNAFLAAGINTFSTTVLHEAVRVRELAPQATIFLMNPTTEFAVLKENDIHMTLPSLEFYRQYQAELSGIHVHMEFENLLHRSGFKTFDEMRAVIKLDEQRLQHEQMHIRGIWTHFGYADEFDVLDYNDEKSAWLTGLEAMLADYHFDFVHAQNSASFVRDGLFAQHTHARLGIILYGSRPYSNLDEKVTVQALTVSANVIQIRTLGAGESAGYSFAYTADKETEIAVIDIGYGDGILRTRSQHDCLINGRRYPIRALMMSHLFVEVDDKVKQGDTVILYSNDIRIDEHTFKGVGANSEQLSALNHHSLKKEII